MIDPNKIPNWRWRWYAYAAHDLLELIQDLRNEIAGKIGLIMDMQEKISKLKLELLTERERTKKAKTFEAASEVVREKLRGGELVGVLNARELASKQRISDLENENRSLQDKLKQRGNGC